MAQPQRQANFFVRPDGIVLTKAKPLSPSQRRRIFERDGRTCSECNVAVRWGGSYDSPFSNKPACGAIDHIFPRSRGGQNDDGNLRLLCKSCNSSKGAN